MNERMMRELLGEDIFGGLIEMFAKAEAMQERFDKAFEDRLELLADITMDEVIRDERLGLGKFVEVGEELDIEGFDLEIDVDSSKEEGWLKKIAVSTYNDIKVATFEVTMTLTKEDDGIRQGIEVSKITLV